MLKYVVAILGGIAILMGLMDWLAGALLPHGRELIISGVIGLAVAGVLHLRQKWQKSRNPKILPLPVALVIAIFGVADTCAAGIHDVLIRPDITPMVQNPKGVSGLEAWIIIGALVVVGLAWLIVQKFLRGCFQ